MNDLYEKKQTNLAVFSVVGLQVWLNYWNEADREMQHYLTHFDLQLIFLHYAHATDIKLRGHFQCHFSEEEWERPID